MWQLFWDGGSTTQPPTHIYYRILNKQPHHLYYQLSLKNYKHQIFINWSLILKKIIEQDSWSLILKVIYKNHGILVFFFSSSSLSFKVENDYFIVDPLYHNFKQSYFKYQVQKIWIQISSYNVIIDIYNFFFNMTYLFLLQAHKKNTYNPKKKLKIKIMCVFVC